MYGEIHQGVAAHLYDVQDKKFTNTWNDASELSFSIQ